jgi:hypothetical protein
VLRTLNLLFFILLIQASGNNQDFKTTLTSPIENPSILFVKTEPLFCFGKSATSLPGGRLC